jgi:hypothetical protein
MCGDNVNSVHKMRALEDAPDVIVGYCERCKKRYYCRKVDGRVEKKYSDIYKRDTLQPHMNLYHKEYPKNLKILA